MSLTRTKRAAAAVFTVAVAWPLYFVACMLFAAVVIAATPLFLRLAR